MYFGPGHWKMKYHHLTLHPHPSVPVVPLCVGNRDGKTPPRHQQDQKNAPPWQSKKSSAAVERVFPGHQLQVESFLVGGWATHLKNISQIGSFPQIGMNIKNIWNHHLVSFPMDVQFLFQSCLPWKRCWYSKKSRLADLFGKTAIAS